MVRTPRWRVVIVDDHDQSRADVGVAILAAGGDVVGETVRCDDAVALVRRARPDVGIFAVGLGDGDGVAAAGDVVAAADCPVVLFTSHTDDKVVARARTAGVMAYLLKPLRPAEVAPTLDLAIARFRDARTLRQQLEDRKHIERAKGVLMVRYGLSEEQAFQRLRRSAMDSRRPMVDIARALLVSASLLRDVPVV